MTRDLAIGTEKIVSNAKAFAAIALLYLIYHLVGIGCPIRFLTGISCPGCGMTRAVVSLLSFRISDALNYHPLVFLLPFAAFVFLMKKRMPRTVFQLLISAMVALILIVYLIRMFDPHNEIVTFDIHHGFIVRMIRKIL